MQRFPRKFWTWLITIAAVLVLAAAGLSGLFQIAVQAMPGYRADVEQYVQRVAGRPVKIGALGLKWHYYYPELQLKDIKLLSADGAEVLLSAQELRLGFSLLRAVRGEFTPNRLELQEFTLDLHRTRDGRLLVEGMEEDEDTPSADRTEALRQLSQFAELRLVRCRLNLHDERKRETLSFGITDAQFNRGLLRNALEAELVLPATFGDTAHVEASMSGEPLDPATWSGDWRADLAGLSAGPWFKPYLAPSASIELAGAETTVQGRLDKGQWVSMRADLRAGPVTAHRGRAKAGFQSLNARVDVDFKPDGWHAQLRRFDLESTGGRWPSAEAELTYSAPAGAPPVWEAKAAYVRLDDLAPWLAIAHVPDGVADFAGIKGEWRNFELRVQTGGPQLQYSARGDFSDLSLPATAKPAGFAGLTGEMAADENGGRAVLHEGPVKLELPGLLSTPIVSVESFESEVEWKRQQAAWQLHVPQFRWTLLTTRGAGHLDLVFPDDKRQPAQIDLNAKFSADDVTQAKPLMPIAWGAGLTEYLDRSILGGHAPQAELTIKGPLADFPYAQNKTGMWALDIVAQDVLFAYQPDWPQLEHVNATLKFRGNGLAIEASAGQTAGNALKTARASFPDFSTGDLVVDGSVQGEAAHMYDFLRASPLRDALSTLVNRTSGDGPATVDIHLLIPVKHAQDTSWSGRVKLDGVQLKYRNLPEPIRNIRGEIIFSPQGLLANKVTGQFYDVNLDGTLQPLPDGGSRLSAAFNATVDPKGKGISSFIPEFVRPWLAGTSAWTAQLGIGGESPMPLTLTSDLEGVEIRLPAPVGKIAGLAAPVTVTISERPQAPLWVTIDLEDRFGASIELTPARLSGWNLRGGALRIGGGALPAVQGPGITIGGTVDELDVKTWLRVTRGPGGGSSGATVRKADLTIGRAKWDAFAVRDARYQWVSQKSGWDMTVTGKGATGNVHYDDGSPARLAARLEYLAAEYKDLAGGDAAPLDPNEQPLLDVNILQFRLGDANLGHAVLVTDAVSHGQAVKALKAEGGSLALTGDGEWKREGNKSTAALNFDATSTDIAALLRALGYSVSVEAKNAKMKGKLTWLPAEAGIDLAQANGRASLNFENGQLRAVDPGASGRVLGLLNFFALSRRLTLNFSDVVKKGLGYDRIQGDFRFADGNARTDNLRIDAPSMRMDIKGRIGLAARDYDEAVTVYPDVSAGVTLASLLLLGPVGGVLTLIGQELLKKPLDQLTQLSYRVTGSWDNPRVEKASAETPGSQRDTGGSPSQRK